jgi:hypothetical protein
MRPLDIAQAGGVQHRAGAAEQQALQHGVADAVEERRGQRQGGQHGESVGAEQLGQAEADGDDADVLDRRVG